MCLVGHSPDCHRADDRRDAHPGEAGCSGPAKRSIDQIGLDRVEREVYEFVKIRDSRDDWDTRRPRPGSQRKEEQPPVKCRAPGVPNIKIKQAGEEARR
jgi:hypothetical protein